MKRIALLSLLVLVSVAGCIQSAPDREPHWKLSSQESATYVLASMNETLRFSIMTTWEGPYLLASINVGENVDGVTAKINATTGELLTSSDGSVTKFYWGTDRTLPTGHHVASLGLSLSDLTRAAIPLGPQWALMSGDAGGIRPWGESVVSSRSTSTGWNLTASGACQSDCRFTGVANLTVKAEMNGQWHSLLPEAVTYSMGGSTLGALARITHARTGPSVQPEIHAPTPYNQAMVRDACNQMPCESEDWPRNLSLAFGLSGLGSSVQWQEWALRNPRAILTYASAAAFPAASVGSIEGPDLGQWSFRFSGQASKVEIILTGDTISPIPPAVQQFIEEPLEFFDYPGQTPPHQLLSLDQLANALLPNIQIPLDDVKSLSFMSFPQDAYPDPRGGFVITFDTNGGPFVQGSAVRGGPTLVANV